MRYIQPEQAMIKCDRCQCTFNDNKKKSFNIKLSKNMQIMIGWDLCSSCYESIDKFLHRNPNAVSKEGSESFVKALKKAAGEA